MNACADQIVQDYVHLTSDPKNASIAKTIHSAAFLVSLDSNTPSEPVSFSRELWHGGLSNRWVDKPVQFIVYDNGKAGILGEHAVMDGTPTVRMCDDVINRIASPSFDRGSPSSSSTPSQPEPLDWNVTPTTLSAISAAETAASELCGSQTLSVHRTPYGKRAIKTFGVSPDSWAQLVVQLAYRRLLGGDLTKRAGGTYEAASTRKFLKGRTEAIRVVTAASDAWTKSMDDPDASAEDKKRLFAEAVKAHVQSARSSGAGQGIDRHLFGELCIGFIYLRQ
jgi:carnitine O-acetyltransferase